MLSKPAQDSSRLGLPAGQRGGARANKDQFPDPPGLFTIEDLGGWEQVNADLFDIEGGSIAKIEEDAGVSTAKDDRRTDPATPGRPAGRPRPRHLDAVAELIVLLPLAAVVVRSTDGGFDAFWSAVSSRQAVAALRFTIGVSLVATLINALTGTLIACGRARPVPRQALVNALIDLPFALPTIVAGLTLLALYGPTSPLGIDVAYTQFAVLLALLFVTLLFVIRSVQPVLIELDKEMEEAALSLGASNLTVFTR